MSYRDELEALARGLHEGEHPAEAIHAAYLLGIEAYREALKAQEPDVFRLVTKDGELIPHRSWSTVKRFYETAAGARRARQFGPEGSKVQAGRVEWEDV